MAKRKTKPAKLIDVLGVLRGIAPEYLAEPWDKVGLQIVEAGRSVTRGVLCIDLTEAVMAEAVRLKAELVVAYHPVLFEPVARLTGSDWKQRVVAEAVRRGVAVYSPHTALDAVRGGINDWLCDGLGAADVRFSMAVREVPTADYKVVVTVPPGEADAVRAAAGDAGAGWVGHYSACSFNATGFGTFFGEAGSRPAVGDAGKLERVEELRLEMNCVRSEVGAVVRAIKAAHPYETPAVDVYKLAPDFEAEDEEQGAGRVCRLKRSVTPGTLVSRVKKRLGLKRVRVAMPERIESLNGEAGKVGSVGVCVGAGGSLFETYEAGGAGCDVYVTGEMRHHQVLDLVSRGKGVVLCGHTNTERPYLGAYRERIVAGCEAAGVVGVDWRMSEADRCPWGEG